ncbi:uncharacterized protein MONOS_7406 [Monocercomonoides exilis]|uniref:uncharacterized protein n=1 Tax=Monocercomonoides exilis TaxID=2049356 RepID=UPI00355A7DC2|nr:hypothetical protein MONOS_7406 [Monocercomonoides exilis]|eukprot:MONOS_7406.1-p1 / transcript=MONOS_7406.1 / gene=MONOS_7406 / organism=Monocercomonoides_exilis_PA203 / gene_product=unspecified product / transcript_product=unspecified product / location=Mono_scaffold00252:28047-28470(+) / protein_length=122 / sequence_SO=supercontig / SO=protein_coding / is_pseudo=false
MKVNSTQIPKKSTTKVTSLSERYQEKRKLTPAEIKQMKKTFSNKEVSHAKKTPKSTPKITQKTEKLHIEIKDKAIEEQETLPFQYNESFIQQKKKGDDGGVNLFSKPSHQPYHYRRKIKSKK